MVGIIRIFVVGSSVVRLLVSQSGGKFSSRPGKGSTEGVDGSSLVREVRCVETCELT